MKVLIAEDDSTSAIVLRKALEKLGHEAIVATDGEQAYTLLSRDTTFEYRVVISDWMMPGMDGLELTRKLREERGPDAPYRFVILLTARGRPEDRRTGLEAGADDFMVKPLDMGDLIPRLSIAERMLALEDAAFAKSGGRPASKGEGGATRLPATDKDAASALPSPESGTGDLASGKAAASRILLAALHDFDAEEIHFEPRADRNYRVRVRDNQGSLHELPDMVDVFEAVTYLVPQANGKSFRLELTEPTLVTVAVLPTAIGDRVRVTLFPDSLLGSPTRLTDLPMNPVVLASLKTLLQKGRTQGGILFIAGAKRYRHLKNRTLSALRYFVTDPNTIVLDDIDGQKLYNLLAQNPDVIVNYDLGGKFGEADFMFTPPVHGVLTLTATDARIGASSWDGRVGLSSPVYLPILGTLLILPLASDGANAEDRYELLTTDERFVSETKL